MTELLETIAARLRFRDALLRLPRLLGCTAGLYLAMLLAARTCVLPELFHPLTAILPVLLSLVFALALTPRPSRESAAQAADTQAGDNLLLTALQSRRSQSVFATILQEQVDAFLPKIVPADVAPIPWRGPAQLIGVATLVLALAAAFVPTRDPFGKQDGRQLLGESAAVLEAMAEDTEARLELLATEERPDVNSALADYAAELEQINSAPDAATGDRLHARRKQLTQLWQEHAAQLASDGASARPKHASGQQVGGAEPGAKLESLAQQLRSSQDVAPMQAALKTLSAQLSPEQAVDPVVLGAIERLQDRLAMLEAGLPPESQVPEIEREARELSKALDPQVRAPQTPEAAIQRPLTESEVAEIMERAFCPHCRLLGTDNSCPACHGTGVPLEKLEAERLRRGGVQATGSFGSEQDGSEQREHADSAASDSDRKGVTAESARDALSQSEAGRGKERVRKRLEETAARAEAAMGLPEEARQQALMELRTDLDGIADETLTLGLQSEPITEAQARAASQLRMAGIEGLSEEALQGLLDSLKLTQEEIDRLSAMRAELRAMNSALRSSQALGEMAGLPGQDDGKGKGGSIAKQGQSITGSLREALSQSQISNGASTAGAPSAGRVGGVKSIAPGAAREVKQAVSSAIDRERVPAGYHEMVKRYFGTGNAD
ncbi:MAG: hypothetical protein ACI8W8_000078 [Rhodothermales bacterium]|jgi:hypothetical protein